MNASQTATYERALARATEENLSIAYIASTNPTNIPGAPVHPVYLVSSSSHPGMFYSVVQRGQVLCCTCPAAESGSYCKHRAVVTFHMISQAKLARKDAKHAADTKAADEVIGGLDTLTSSEIDDSDRD